MQYVETPTWIDVPVVRSTADQTTLADVVSRLSAADARLYRSDRDITTCHESTHGVNAVIRNQQIRLEERTIEVKGSGLISRASRLHFVRVPIPTAIRDPRIKLGNVNGFYVLGGNGLRLNEPSFHLSDVAKAVPAELQGMSYKLYLQDQQRYWEDSPLYVLDEWSAYLNGLQCGLESGGHAVLESDVLQPMEFAGYAWTLLQLLREELGHVFALTPYRDFIAYQTVRTFRLCSDKRLSALPQARLQQACAAFQRSFATLITILCGLSWIGQLLPSDNENNGLF